MPKILILLCGFLIVGFSVYLVQNTNKATPNIQTKNKAIYSDAVISSDSISSQETDFSEYKKYKNKLEQIVQNQDPSDALRFLNQDIQTNQLARENCHSFTHIIGNYALKKYNSDLGKILSYNVDVCGGGYVHGVIEKYLDTYPDVDISTVCADAEDGACFHAIGHGFMLITKFDIDQSVLKCQKLTSARQELWCGEGVFMENFDSENVEDSQKPFLYPQNPEKICPNYKNPYRSTCFYYLGRYLTKKNTNPTKTLQICLDTITDENDIASCVRGVSSGIVRNDLFQPYKIESHCDAIPSYRTNCLMGAINYHLFILKNPKDTDSNMCQKFVNISNRDLCQKLVANSEFNL